MERLDKSLERTLSTGTPVQHLDAEPRTLTTLILDVLERLTILEQAVKFADLQRKGIEDKINQLTLICAAKKDVEELDMLVKQHERFFSEFRFGLRAAKVGWAVLYVSGGSVFGAFVQWWMIHH